jgi:hypothetical protein
LRYVATSAGVLVLKPRPFSAAWASSGPYRRITASDSGGGTEKTCASRDTIVWTSRPRCPAHHYPMSTKTDSCVGDWAASNNVELGLRPVLRQRLNRIEAQFTALRYSALDGTDRLSHADQASMIRRYTWRNRHAHDKQLRQVVTKASTIKAAEVAGRGTSPFGPLRAASCTQRVWPDTLRYRRTE